MVINRVVRESGQRLQSRRWICAFALGLAAPALSQPITLSTLLAEMTDRDAIARLPRPAYTCRQASSYDRASTSPDAGESWFANGDAGKFLGIQKKAGREEAVLMDADGPGAIVRLWSANPAGTLRIYLDGGEAPVVEAPLADMVRGSGPGALVDPPLAQERSRGCSLYLPIPYASRCTVTCERPGNLYYHVDYRTYAKGTTVESFPKAGLAGALDQMAKAQSSLANPRDRKPNWFESFPAQLDPGQTKQLSMRQGPGCVSQLSLSLAKNTALGRLPADKLADALRSTVLSISFDGEQTVWCPLSDFFGSGVGANAFQDWWRACAPSEAMKSFWVMPYEKSADIRLTNLADTPVALELSIAGGAWNWDDRSMHFGATWRQEGMTTRPFRDWNYITVTGEGVYAGDSLTVVNPNEAWWGEGDEKVYVDGEVFPSHFGTGTEDYYGYAWSSPELFTGPWHEQTRCDGPGTYGVSCVGRVRLLDGIPFTRSLRFDMEVWHWKPCDVTYSAAAFYYARPGATTNRRPQPEEARRGAVRPPPLPPPFAMAGAIECEALPISAKSPGLETEDQELTAFGRGRWSNEHHLWARATKDGELVELKIPAPGEKARAVTLHATRSWDYGVVRFFLNGVQAGPDVDLCDGATDASPSGPIDLGTATPRDGAITLRAQVVGPGKGAKGTQRFFGLDCVTLTDAK